MRELSGEGPVEAWGRANWAQDGIWREVRCVGAGAGGSRARLWTKVGGKCVSNLLSLRGLDAGA